MAKKVKKISRQAKQKFSPGLLYLILSLVILILIAVFVNTSKISKEPKARSICDNQSKGLCTSIYKNICKFERNKCIQKPKTIPTGNQQPIAGNGPNSPTDQKSCKGYFENKNKPIYSLLTQSTIDSVSGAGANTYSKEQCFGIYGEVYNGSFNLNKVKCCVPLKEFARVNNTFCASKINLGTDFARCKPNSFTDSSNPDKYYTTSTNNICDSYNSSGKTININGGNCYDFGPEGTSVKDCGKHHLDCTEFTKKGNPNYAKNTKADDITTTNISCLKADFNGKMGYYCFNDALATNGTVGCDGDQYASINDLGQINTYSRAPYLCYSTKDYKNSVFCDYGSASNCKHCIYSKRDTYPCN